MYIGIEKGTNVFVGTENNKVKSENDDEFYPRTFVVNAYIRKCPLDKFKYYQEDEAPKEKKKPSSFLQLDNKYI